MRRGPGAGGPGGRHRRHAERLLRPVHRPVPRNGPPRGRETEAHAALGATSRLEVN